MYLNVHVPIQYQNVPVSGAAEVAKGPKPPRCEAVGQGRGDQGSMEDVAKCFRLFFDSEPCLFNVLNDF